MKNIFIIIALMLILGLIAIILLKQADTKKQKINSILISIFVFCIILGYGQIWFTSMTCVGCILMFIGTPGLVISGINYIR